MVEVYYFCGLLLEREVFCVFQSGDWNALLVGGGYGAGLGYVLGDLAA